MHLPTQTRWVDQDQIAALAQSLDAEISQLDSTQQPRTDWSAKAAQYQKWSKVAVVVALVLIGLLLGQSVMRHVGSADQPITMGLIGRWAGGLVVFAAIACWGFSGIHGVRVQRLALRDRALREFAGRAKSLRCGEFARVTGESVGTFPWIATELDHVVECDLHGTYRGHRLAVLRCAYVVDKSLTALEASTGKLAANVMSHVQHEGVRRNELEAVVFFDALPELPDSFWAAKKQPLIWYFKRAFGSELEVQSDDSHWLASSDGELVNPNARRLFATRPNAIVQVLGEHVVVIPHAWDWHRPEMAQDADQVGQNLDWACELYESLNPGAVPAPSRIEKQPAPQPLRAVQAAAPAIADAPAPKPRRARRIVAAICGFICFSVGGIVLLALLSYTFQARQAAGWPTAQGRIVESAVDVRKGATEMFAARVEYDFTVDGRSYHGKRLAIGPPRWDRNRANVEAVLAKYAANQPVEVRFNPKNPSDAVLLPHIAAAGIHQASCIIAAVLAGGGAFLIYRGFRRPRAQL